MPKVEGTINVTGYWMHDKGEGYDCKAYEVKEVQPFTPNTTLSEVLEWITGDEAHETEVLNREHGMWLRGKSERRDGLFKIEIAIPEAKEIDVSKIEEKLNRHKQKEKMR